MIIVNPNTKSPSRAVRLLEGYDFRCAMLGSLGFSIRHIVQHTGLTEAQVCYRLRLGGIRIADYRNGKSAVATSMLRKARLIAVPVVEKHLREILATSRERKLNRQLRPGVFAGPFQPAMRPGNNTLKVA